ncbi:MAG: hypothetical protein ACRET2_03110 [Steroidobacteraceae bacterium]
MTGSEHRFDRWAKRLARVDRPAPGVSSTVGNPSADISRRGLLAAGATGALGIALHRAPRAIAASTPSQPTTSCSCEDYADYVYASCAAPATDALLTAGNGGAGMAMAMANNAFMNHVRCAGPSEAAQAGCREVPCASGQTCVNRTDPRASHNQPPTCGCPDGSTPDFQSDSNNCGTCGNRCGSPSTCQNGHCQLVCDACGSGQQSPGMQVCVVDGQAQCVDTWTDPENCGSCGNVCPDSVNNFRGLCNCGQCDGCEGGLGGIRCCPSDTCAHACPSPGESCP